ncbi:hypothetical protein GQR58_030138 [Nymphon striatum]|nr:hypothetical protein GQR58_030138 [Nymphon striatum]
MFNRFLNRIWNLCSWKAVEHAANVATICAFIVAVWVVAVPSVATEFLRKVADSNQKLADEIPYWLTIGDGVDQETLNYLDQVKPGAVFALPLENRANFIINDITVRVFDGSGGQVSDRDSIFLAPFGRYTVYDSAPSGSFSEGMTICISGFSSRADKFFYEKRVMRPEGIDGRNEMMTTEYEFEDKAGAHTLTYNARLTARAAPLTSLPMPSTVSHATSASIAVRHSMLLRVIICSAL